MTMLLVPFLALFLGSDPVSAQAQPVFTNSDVVALAKAGLPEEVIIAKIRQASEVKFNLEVSDLIHLREEGVSDPVIKAMLDRATSKPIPSPSGPPGMVLPGLSPVLLVTREAERQLSPSMGQYSSAGFVVRVSWMNFPGLRAGTRTTDRRPQLVLRSAHDPTSSHEHLLVRLERDDDDRVRSLKVKGVNLFNTANMLTPDKDWTIPYTVEVQPDGAWRLTPASDLKPGEYGLYTEMGLYDFGVE